MPSLRPTSRTESEGFVKIRFPLNEEDWEGLDAENLWAEPISDGAFKIDNVPFYVYGVSNEDVVSARLIEGRLQFQSVLTRGGHSTYRVWLQDPEGYEGTGWKELWPYFAELGCSFERAKQRWMAIDVPKASNVDAVYALLAEGEADGVWEFSEGHCGHSL